MSRLYRTPMSHRPPLAYGGHAFKLAGTVAQCRRCAVTVPAWSIHKATGMWMTFAARWCPRLIRALPPASPPPRTSTFVQQPLWETA